jgi:hypothetical protein
VVRPSRGSNIYQQSGTLCFQWILGLRKGTGDRSGRPHLPPACGASTRVPPLHFLSWVTAASAVSNTRLARLPGLFRQATVESAIHTLVPRKQHLSRFDPLNRPPRSRRQTACKPGSVPPPGVTPGAVMAIPLGRPSPSASCDRPERRREDPPGASDCSGRLPLLLGLAPGGVFPAAAVAGGAVRSYRTVSPLPPAQANPGGAGGVLSVALSLGSPPPGVTRHRTSVEPGLSSPRATVGSGHPTVWRQLIWAAASSLSKPPPTLL